MFQIRSNVTCCSFVFSRNFTVIGSDDRRARKVEVTKPFEDWRLYKLYDMIYLLTAVGLPPGSSSTVHTYSQTIHRTTQNKQYISMLLIFIQLMHN
jgi:hypothetical protein